MTPARDPVSLQRGFFERSAHQLAPQLLGATLLVDGVGGVIVELEIYEQSDPASHSYGGPTKRNASMFGPAGHAYVYRSYGVHWCLNFVCAPPGEASALLVRALEPTHGVEKMIERRGVSDPRGLCSGPGKLCQALAVGAKHDGLPLDETPFQVLACARELEIVRCRRIGITRAREKLWRLCVSGSPYLSYGRGRG